jgi:predicted nucleotidyltransferase
MTKNIMQFSTYVLDESLKKKRVEKEKLRKYTLKKLDTILSEMSQIIFFKDAYIFGSITKPHQFTEESDVDIAFLGLDDKDFFKAMSFISGQLERDVDIIQIENHRLSEKVVNEGIKWIRKY